MSEESKIIRDIFQTHKTAKIRLLYMCVPPLLRMEK